jgi:hypothetical protein
VRTAAILVLGLGVIVLGVPGASAAILDLTTPGADGWIGAGYFLQTDEQPTGSGVILPFVRIQDNGMEHGFNTDYRPLDGDLEDVDNSPFTHSVQIGALQATEVDGELMVPFLLDINQSSSRSLLSLDVLEVYAAPAPDLNLLADVQASILIYEMGAENKIFLDYALESGSGSGDMIFYLPRALFAGLESQFLYLYSVFGATGGMYESNAGYEEWAELHVPVSTESRTLGSVKDLFR